MNRAQLEHVHRRLPERWLSGDEFKELIHKTLNVPTWDGGTVGSVVETLRATGAAELRWVGGEYETKRREWRRGALPEAVDPAQQFIKDRDRAAAEVHEQRLRSERARREAAAAMDATSRALERAALMDLIDERLVALGLVSEEEARAAREPRPAVVHIG